MQTIEQENAKITRAGYPPLADCEPLHTPGPWRIEITDTGFRITHSDSTLRSHIATLHEAALCEEHGDTFANANLIVSAPEMLDALEWAVETADSEQYEASWYASARAAIAKAKGETK
jgi:hypothetical protein